MWIVLAIPRKGDEIYMGRYPTEEEAMTRAMRLVGKNELTEREKAERLVEERKDDRIGSGLKVRWRLLDR